MESSEFHFSDWISPDNYERLTRNPRLDVMIVERNEWVSAIFNKKRGPFASKALRQAVVAALDMGPSMLRSPWTREHAAVLPRGDPRGLAPGRSATRRPAAPRWAGGCRYMPSPSASSAGLPGPSS